MEDENKKMDDPEATTVTIEAPSDEATTPKKSKKSKRPPPDPTNPAVIAEKAAVHTAEAEAEAAALKASQEDAKPSKSEECKYYTSLTLGTLCIVSVFAFLFLIPFVLDPAISTLTHDFVEEPVTCKVTTVDVGHGKSNCTWSSCREGCTADMYHCYQVRVIYSHSKFQEGKSAAYIHDWVDLERYDTIENKVRNVQSWIFDQFAKFSKVDAGTKSIWWWNLKAVGKLSCILNANIFSTLKPLSETFFKLHHPQ